MLMDMWVPLAKLHAAALYTANKQGIAYFGRGLKLELPYEAEQKLARSLNKLETDAKEEEAVREMNDHLENIWQYRHEQRPGAKIMVNK